MKKLNIVVITLAGLGFVAFGILFLCWPDMLMPGLGIHAVAPESQVEIRAMYGGLELGLGILLLNCFAPERQHFGVLLGFASYAGLGFARAISMLVLGASTPFLWFALIWEATIAGLALLALTSKTKG